VVFSLELEREFLYSNKIVLDSLSFTRSFGFGCPGLLYVVSDPLQDDVLFHLPK
jgi:hypothetical protein